MECQSRVEVCKSPTGGGGYLRATCDVERGQTLLMEPPLFLTENYGVEVCKSPTGGGCCLRATCDVESGQTMLVEPPFFMTENYDDRAVAEFLALPTARQDAILGSFFAPMDSDRTAMIQERVAGTAADSTRAIQFETILAFNCVDCSPVLSDGSGFDPLDDERSVGIFKLAGKMNHSCEPNATWYTKDVFGTKVVRSTAAVRKGEEVCISYLLDSDLLLPTRERRQKLQSHTEFFCECSLCLTEEDSASVCPCALPIHSGEGSAVLLGGRSEGQASTEESIYDRLARIDQALLDSLDSPEHDADISAEILTLRSIHPLHHTTRRIGRLLYDLHNRLHQKADALQGLELIASYWSCGSSTSRYSCTKAFDLEFLADGFRSARDFRRAEEMYERAWKTQQVLHEPLHPYVECCRRKLASVRLRMMAAETNEPLVVGTLVALRGLRSRRSNGVVGHLRSFQDGEYTVEIGTESVTVAMGNCSSALQPTTALGLVCGQLVLVHGLTSAAGQALNGRIGTVGAFEQGRVSVRGIRRGGGLADLALEHVVIVDELEMTSMHHACCPASGDEGSDTDSETDDEEE